jgi:hypothetical protein
MRTICRFIWDYWWALIETMSDMGLLWFTRNSMDWPVFVVFQLSSWGALPSTVVFNQP